MRLKFVDAPGAGKLGCAQTMLGGTGIAVSRKSAHLEEAVAYAKWMASQEHQQGTYFARAASPGVWRRQPMRR